MYFQVFKVTSLRRQAVRRFPHIPFRYRVCPLPWVPSASVQTLALLSGQTDCLLGVGGGYTECWACAALTEGPPVLRAPNRFTLETGTSDSKGDRQTPWTSVAVLRGPSPSPSSTIKQTASAWSLYYRKGSGAHCTALEKNTQERQGPTNKGKDKLWRGEKRLRAAWGREEEPSRRWLPIQTAQLISDMINGNLNQLHS